MDALKQIPIRYRGELHRIRLINFSVDKEEVMPYLPTPLQPLDYRGRVLISLVNVQLQRMHPTFVPEALHFNYQHIGFRLLLNDAAYTQGQPQGIFFLRSFTDKPLMVWGGALFTNYQLELASLTNQGDTFVLRQQDKYLHYTLHPDQAPPAHPDLKQNVQRLDRAYSLVGEEVVRVKIMREKWPLEEIACSGFATDFFQTARLEGAFQVREMIPYEWLPPVPVAACASLY